MWFLANDDLSFLLFLNIVWHSSFGMEKDKETKAWGPYNISKNWSKPKVYFPITSIPIGGFMMSW